jgi:hypothetical protein
MTQLEITYPNTAGLTQPIETTHEGFSGGVEIKPIQIKSVSDEHYYQNISIEVSELAGTVLDAGAVLSSNGWSIKLVSSEDEPEEETWNNVLPNTELALTDIGNPESSNTDFSQKVWIRIFCPGHSDPEILTSKLKLKYNTLLVTNVANP